MDILMKDNRLPMSNGDFQITDGTEEIKQHIVVALNTFYGDWILDYTKGIDYAYGLRHEEFLEYDIKNQINGVSGVTSIDNFQMEFDKKNYTINVTAGINTIYGKLDIQTALNRN